MRESLRKVKEVCFPVIDDQRWLSNVDNTNVSNIHGTHLSQALNDNFGDYTCMPGSQNFKLFGFYFSG